MREPNSTPMVTSWVGLKRPSQSRIVSCGGGGGYVSRAPTATEGEGRKEGMYRGFAAAGVANVDYFLERGC